MCTLVTASGRLAQEQCGHYRITDRPDMCSAVYRGRKASTQTNKQNKFTSIHNAASWPNNSVINVVIIIFYFIVFVFSFPFSFVFIVDRKIFLDRFILIIDENKTEIKKGELLMAS